MTIGEKRVFTFMTQALGLMADLDLGTFGKEHGFGKYLTEIPLSLVGTEHLRWMGDLRFIVGFIQGCTSSRFFLAINHHS